jgi:hypothetical protein
MVKHFELCIKSVLEALINRNMNIGKNALKTQNLTMNEIVEKHFTYTEPQKQVNENAVATYYK